MDEYTVTIILTLVGFTALAAILLVPVYRFLKKEEKIADAWTEEAIRARQQEPSSNGSEKSS